MSIAEAVDITGLRESDLLLFSKLATSPIQIHQKLRIVKVSDEEVSDKDVVWPNLRKLIKEYSARIEEAERKIDEKTAQLKHKIRHKTAKQLLLKIMKTRKAMETKRDRLLDQQLQFETILG